MNQLRYTVLLISLFFSLMTNAQIRGIVIDDATGDSIPFASVMYKGHRIGMSCSSSGRFSIARHNGWKLTFSAIGYKSRTLNVDASTPKDVVIKLTSSFKNLDEVVVKSKKAKYSRKNNPAVELMKRVIQAKQHNKLSNKDFYQYTTYEKMTTSLNQITPHDLDSGLISGMPWLRDQVEYCPLNSQLILPLMMNEKVTRTLYRKDPSKRRTIIIGNHTQGLSELFHTGDIFKELTDDAFRDVDVYDNQVHLLRRTFTSPIADNAISFYRYYIMDTVAVERDSCFHLYFTPNNQQDIGFSGDIYIMKDSTLHVRKVTLSLPRQSGVNYVEGISISQQYSHLPSGDWVLTVNDMVLELRFNQQLAHALVVRSSTRSDYSFDPIDNKELRGMATLVTIPDAEMQDEQFWESNRKVPLTTSESNMKHMISRARNAKGFNWVMAGLQILIENFVETSTSGNPNYFDIGPINTIVSHNSFDGFRVRLSGVSTAAFNPHFFVKGYVAHGFDTKKNYYSADLIYSLNKKKYSPMEFPKRTLTFHSSYDICSPSDKFSINDKDNVFNSFKWSKETKMMYYKRQKLEFEYEQEWGFRFLTHLKREENEMLGDLVFPDFCTTEARIEVEIAQGRTFINTKQRRMPTNNNAPVFTLSHTVGFKGFLGGDYNYNVTELKIYKRFWLNSWGRLNCFLRGGIQWDAVPYPLLLMPNANLSYISQRGNFNLINNMEFLNDRYASLDMEWDMAGKIFNRIPLLRRMKLREVIGFKALWGTLSEKNATAFPEGCYAMDGKEPYGEFAVGVTNLFKFFRVQYVHRLNYNSLPTAHRHGVRIGFELNF